MARKPAPFKRPSIDLSAPKKEWREIYVNDVREEDIVQGHNRGLVEEVSFFQDTATISYANGRDEILKIDDRVTAFTRVANG